jgi:Icc-related predicted phosphoesterase
MSTIPFTLHKQASGKILFVSDIHGRQDKLEQELIAIAESANPPETVVFLGDIVGTKPLEQLQKLFYNGVYNHIKKLLAEKPNVTDQEILNFSTDEKGNSLGTGIQNIWNFLYNLYPEMEPINMAHCIREIANFENYGHYVSNLALPLRQILQTELFNNAESIYKIMKKLTDNGSFVIIIEGNWDARTPLDFAIGPKCVAIPPQNRDFYYKKFIAEKHNRDILYLDYQHILTLDDIQMVFMPFDVVMNYDGTPIWKDPGKETVLVSHTQINWQAIKGDTAMTGESKKIEENTQKILKKLNPKYAVHGHLHNSIGNIDGYSLTNGMFVYYLPIGTCHFIDF